MCERPTPGPTRLRVSRRAVHERYISKSKPPKGPVRVNITLYTCESEFRPGFTPHPARRGARAAMALSKLSGDQHRIVFTQLCNVWTRASVFVILVGPLLLLVGLLSRILCRISFLRACFKDVLSHGLLFATLEPLKALAHFAQRWF